MGSFLSKVTNACPDNTNIKSNVPYLLVFPQSLLSVPSLLLGVSGKQPKQCSDFWLVCMETNGFFYLFQFTSLFFNRYLEQGH